MASEQRRARQWPQYVAALIANLGALSIGSLFGWMSPAGPRLKAVETGVEMTEEQLSWVAGLMPLGAAFTPLIVPFLIDRIGRKRTLLSVVPPFVAGFALLAWANSPGMYYAGRFVCGISGGAFSIVTPVYTAEIGEKRIRGALGTMYEALLGLGLEVAFVVGGFLPLFWLCIVCGMVPIIFCVLFLFMPESPHYLYAQGKTEETQRCLKWLRGDHFDISHELKEIEESLSCDKKIGLDDFKTRAAKRSILISIGLMVFQQSTGVAAITFNATKMFKLSGSSIEPNAATMIVGLTFIFNFVSTLLVDRLGRRILLLTSSVFMCVCMASLGVFFTMLSNEQDVSNIQWIPLTAMSVFMIMFAIGWGPIAWMMMGEIFPSKIKGTCSSFACCINWLTGFCVAKFFPDLVREYGEGPSFCVFSVIAALSVIFVYTSVPETKGKSLEEIQRELSGGKAIMDYGSFQNTQSIEITGHENKAFSIG